MNTRGPSVSFIRVELFPRPVICGFKGILNKELNKALQLGEGTQIADFAIANIVPFNRDCYDVKSGIRKYARGAQDRSALVRFNVHLQLEIIIDNKMTENYFCKTDTVGIRNCDYRPVTRISDCDTILSILNLTKSAILLL